MTSAPPGSDGPQAALAPALDARVVEHLAQLESEPGARGGVSRRKEQGAHYTPAPLVDFVIAETLDGWAAGSSDTCAIDPACGSGNFLVALARALSARLGEPIEETIERRIHGVDVDPVAVELARAALLALVPAAGARARVGQALERRVVVHDALADDLELRLGRASFDLVVGNPPFLGQLRRGTARSRADAKRLAARTGGAVRRYADLAGAFLLTNLARLAPGGRLGFVMPLSFLSTADGRAVRDAALAGATLRSIWAARESLFEDAKVRVAAVVLQKRLEKGSDAGSAERPTGTRRAFGPRFEPIPGDARGPARGDETWAPLLATGFGAPEIECGAPEIECGAPAIACGAVAAERTIGAIARITADFRDQYYGLRGAIVEDVSEGVDRGTPAPDAGAARKPRLISTRHVDLAACRWGSCEVRILGARWRRPLVAVERLAEDPSMAAWIEARLVPKVLVATQTRVIEAWLDEAGRDLPLVPLLVAVPRPGVPIVRLAAAIASPVVAARAVSLYAGSALSAGAIKLSARQLLSMPLPRDEQAWAESAAHFERAMRLADDGDEPGRRRALDAFAVRSSEAHGLEGVALERVLDFWRARFGAVPGG